MLTKLVDILECPNCHKGDLEVTIFEQTPQKSVKNGIMSCGNCDKWFKIEDEVIDLLPLSLRNNDEYTKFGQKWNLQV